MGRGAGCALGAPLNPQSPQGGSQAGMRLGLGSGAQPGLGRTAQEEAGWPWWRRTPLACRPVWCPAPRRAPDREEVGSYLAHRRRHRASRARLPEDAPSSGPCGPVWGPGEEPRGPQGGSRSLAFVLEAELSPCASLPSSVSCVSV